MVDIQVQGQGKAKLTFWIERLQELTFLFTENGLDWDVTPYTWEFFVKKYPGDKKKVISLTLGNGISIPIYDDNKLVCRFEVSDTKLKEGQYYFELVRTDLPRTQVNGWCDFTYGPK